MVLTAPNTVPRKTRRSTIFGVIGSCLMAITAAAWPQSAEAGVATLKIGGTGGALGGVRLLAEAFMHQHPDIEVQVLPSLGSGGGIRALRAGAIDIALSSRPRKQKEREQADDQIIEIEYARTPLVFVTTPETNIENISVSEAVAIYRRESAMWPDGQLRRLILRPSSESDTRILRRLSKEMDSAVEAAAAQPGMIVAINDQENARALEAALGTFGTMTLGQMRAEGRRLKALGLDGVMPSTESLATGSYPMFKRFYLITNPKRAPIAADFVAFLQSTTAAEILSASGHLPTVDH